ncbi:hypothetical protein [Dictyobacter alpinus]|uniref:hypothetical protein n=1 Tax=Dictyobacter alpinus TaxID=2014873 RepID=UPI001387542B|nr:hypothetical protein [Dictyobacter alpinus]
MTDSFFFSLCDSPPAAAVEMLANSGTSPNVTAGLAPAPVHVRPGTLVELPATARHPA